MFVFGKGGDAKVYIGSADMMTRNTENRVEVACPVWNEDIKRRLLHDLHIMLADNVKAREMEIDGTYHKKSINGKVVNAQEIFMKEALEAKGPDVSEKKKRESILARVLGWFGKK